MSDENGDRELEEKEEEDLLASSSGSSSSDSEEDVGGQDEGDGSQNRAGDGSGSESGSESEGDEMDVEEQEKLKNLLELDEKLLQDPNSYELQVERINLLHELGDLDRLRVAREKLNQFYPLSPELWRRWIQDEASLISDTEDPDDIYALFDRAVKDYLSIEVWLEYAKFALERLGQEGGVTKSREVFERAISACGVHVPSGSLLWEAYRGFEAAMLGTMSLPGEIEEQKKRYDAICRRQLSVPLEHMENQFKQISAKIEIDDALETTYQKALEKLKSIRRWEKELLDTSDMNSKTDIYMEYIGDEKVSKTNPARLICLYERAVADLPLVGSLWLDYMDYVSINFQIQELVLETASRASRNCPWVLDIWKKYMAYAESFTSDKETLKGIFEKGIIYCSSGDDVGSFWLLYLEFLRRRIDYNDIKESDVELFNKTLNAAEEHLLQLVVEPNEYILDIILYRARIATHIAKSLDAPKELWNDIFRRGYKNQYRVWFQYFTLENKYGSPKSIRKHLERGLHCVEDNASLVADLWLCYERDFGDLKSMGICTEKIDGWKREAEEYVKAEAGQVSSEPDYRNKNKLKRKRSDQQPDSFREKRSRTGLGYSKSKQSEDKVDGDSKNFKVPFPVKSKDERGRDEHKPKFNPTQSKKDPVVTEDREMKFNPKDNFRTAFLSNLAFTVGEDEIREFLSTCGTVEQVRLVKDFQGRSKGYAYVTLSSQEDVKLALEKDRAPLAGRPVFVSECDPEKASRAPKLKYPTVLEKNKLFVKGLPLSTTVDHLRALFGAFGKVTDVRLVTYRNGNSKGMAYVDFADVESATAALGKTNGQEFEGQVLSVAISNPPKRTSKTDEPLTAALVRRTAKPFVPRSLQVKPTPAPAQEKPVRAPAPSQGQPSGKMNNQDFRKFFMTPPSAKKD